MRKELEDRPRHKLEGELTEFLRFRTGFRIYIKPNIREVLSKACEDLSESVDHNKYFHDEIRDISDGCGAGVHPDSTWLAALKELLKRYEDDSRNINSSAKSVLLKIIATATNSTLENSWEEVRDLILDNIDMLSGWERSHKALPSLIGEVWRNDDGSYSADYEGEVVSVRGAKTSDEERYDYMAGSVLREYGTLYYLFKLLSLIDIADQYMSHPEHFSDSVYCLLHDNEGSTSYLHWKWQVYGVYDFHPAFWRPRSCYSDPDWLANDLLSLFASKFERKDPTQPRVPFEPSDDFSEKFKGYTWQFEMTLNTHLILGDGLESYFEFGDRYLRWINGDGFTQPMIVVPTDDEEGRDALKLALRFISVLSKYTDRPVVPEVEAVQQLRHAPFFSQPRISSFYKFTDTDLLSYENVSEYSEDKFVAVALRREAVNSSSVFYKFLSFYKIIELCCSSVGTDEAVWINDIISNLKEGSYADNRVIEWRDNTLPGGETPKDYLYGSNRCAIAHVNRSNTRGVGKTDPDDPVDFLRVKGDVHVAKYLADKAIEYMDANTNS